MSHSNAKYTPEIDESFGDHQFEISQTEKRWVRASVKTYDKTGTYIFLKLYKSEGDGFFQKQMIGLTVEEYQNLVKARIERHISSPGSEPESNSEKPKPKHKAAKRQKQD